MTSDNKVIVIRKENNPIINNCTIINRGIKRATIDFVYNRESNSASIWSINKVDCNIDITNYSTDRLDFSIIGLETIVDLAFLTHFSSRILGCNSEYGWGNVKGVITHGNY
jgi:hypothetical protein